ncbi:hypothetical protein RB12972 [Rhodopirellula baltica SH 1]|uniref:Uncharacterized protein n=1 Tax=Rhodopirellula baltica (strain DSM 10527 / NCIMB 13988 / SH1) TaxID=243090 RepID=Q7UHU3_RHOBA|nr:hypothetical protein RB12972 [Rhodopirellula baltica SH 1]
MSCFRQFSHCRMCVAKPPSSGLRCFVRLSESLCRVCKLFRRISIQRAIAS